MNESSEPIEAELQEPEELLLFLAIPESKARLLLSALVNGQAEMLRLGNEDGFAVVQEFRQAAGLALCG